MNCLGSLPSTIALLVIGCVSLVVGGVNEYFTKRSPIVPPRLFKVSPLEERAGAVLIVIYRRERQLFC